MNVRIWRHALEPPALKGVSPHIYAMHHMPYRKGTMDFNLYNFFHYIKYISHGHIELCYRYTGAYPNTFFHLLLFWAFYEHIISHLVISYSSLVIYMIAITIRQCVYLFYDICPVIFVIFVIYHVTVYSLSLGLRTNTLARLSTLFLSICIKPLS